MLALLSLHLICVFQVCLFVCLFVYLLCSHFVRSLTATIASLVERERERVLINSNFLHSFVVFLVEQQQQQCECA